MLYTDPLPRDQVGWTRVYRRRIQSDAAEAFRWGGVTSGSAITAFWLLLLPFALANTAGWMAAPKAWRVPFVALMRLACLMLTGIFVLEAVTVIVDLPWHRLGGPTPMVRTIPVVGDTLDDLAGWAWTNPRWVGVVLMAASLLVMVVLTMVASRSHFEQRSTAFRRVWSPATNALVVEGEDLRDLTVRATSPSEPSMWSRPPTVDRLARLHVSFGVGLIGLVAAGVAAGGAQNLPSTPIGLLTLALMGIVIVATLFSQTATGHGVVDRMIAWLPIVTVAITATGLAAFVASDAHPSRHLPGLHDLVFILVAILGASVILAFVSGFSSRPIALIVIGGMAGGGLGAGLAMATERGFGLEGALPNGFGWFAASSMYGFLLIALVFAVRFAWVARRNLHPDRRDPRAVGLPMGALRETIPAVDTAFDILVVALTGVVAVVVAFRWPDLFGQQLPAIDQQPFSPWLGYAATGLFVAIVLMISVAFTLMRKGRLALLSIIGGAVVLLVARFGIPGTRVFGIPLDLGTFPSVAAAVAVLLPASFIVTRIIGGLRNENKRRGIGIIWDLAGMWPRWYHPFAPPPYGPRVVTDLRAEVEHRLELDKRLLLAAHSQGSVVASVVIRQLNDDQRRRLAYLTYGGPVQRLYHRLFPAHFTSTWIAGLRAELEDAKGLRWRNLYRRTDPIGGPIDGVAAVDPIADVARSHGGYELEPEYEQARDAIWGSLSLPQ
jgi:hypothetical protein